MMHCKMALVRVPDKGHLLGSKAALTADVLRVREGRMYWKQTILVSVKMLIIFGIYAINWKTMITKKTFDQKEKQNLTTNAQTLESLKAAGWNVLVSQATQSGGNSVKSSAWTIKETERETSTLLLLSLGKCSFKCHIWHSGNNIVQATQQGTDVACYSTVRLSLTSLQKHIVSSF